MFAAEAFKIQNSILHNRIVGEHLKKTVLELSDQVSQMDFQSLQAALEGSFAYSMNLLREAGE